jgi:pyrroline-5-carboxylate reductase
MKTFSLGFIGGGRITRIFLQAFKNKSYQLQPVVYDTNPEVLKMLKQQFPDIETVSSPDKAASQGTVILAVHPPQIIPALESIKDHISPQSVILSLAPKITINKIADLLNTPKIIRMIPNATSFINEGYNPVTFSAVFSDDEKESFLGIFNLLGQTFETEEYKLEGYAIMSAMLPTYFWFQWKKLEELALNTGLTTQEAKETISSTLKKGIDLLFESGYPSDEVIDLIPVKPIGENEEEIVKIFENKLLSLYKKIKAPDHQPV